MKAAVIGLGKIGLPIAVTIADAGIEVAGGDASQRVVDDVNNGREQLRHVVEVAQHDGRRKVGKHKGRQDGSRQRRWLEDTEDLCHHIEGGLQDEDEVIECRRERFEQHCVDDDDLSLLVGRDRIEISMIEISIELVNVL